MFLKEAEKNCPLINNNGNFQGDQNPYPLVSAREQTASIEGDHNIQDLQSNGRINTDDNFAPSFMSSLNASKDITPENIDNSNGDTYETINENTKRHFVIDNQNYEDSPYIDENERNDDNHNIDISDNEVDKPNYEPENAPFNFEDSDRSYSSADVTPLDGIYDYEVSDSEDSCIQDVNEIRVLPRGIHNPNYPGFQHLAYTLQEFSPQISEIYDNAFFSNVYIRCKDEEELLKLTLENHLNTRENNNNVINNRKEYDLSDDDEGISTKFNDLDDSEYTRDISSDSAIFDNRETDCSQDDICLQSSSISLSEDLNLSTTSAEFQEDLTALRNDIYDVIQKPLESALENVGEVINTVIKHIVEYQNKHEVDVWQTLTQESFQNLVNETTNAMGSIENSPENCAENRCSNGETCLLQQSSQNIEEAIMGAKINAVDAYITNVKEDLFTSPDFEKQICEKTYSQLHTKTEKNETNEKVDMKLSKDFDDNSNQSSRDSANENEDSNRNLDEIQNTEYKCEKRDKLENASSRRHNKKQEKQRCKGGKEAGGFDVYNIETAMPFIDLDVIENHLKAAREEERRRRNDREEIRRRLALGSEIDEYYKYGDRPGKKPSLQARLQSGMNLQICFMNETASDTDSPSEGETGEGDDESDKKNVIEEKCLELYNTPLVNSTSKHSATKRENSVRGAVRPSSLPLSDMARPTLSSNPTTRAAFFECQARLQTEARMALAQAKELAHMQMEIERNKRETSPITEMLRNSLLKAGVKLTGDRRRVSRQMLTDMNVAQLQVIVNELHTQIEYLNESLVKMLIARDELHMGQDSMLVDIEDLTRYLSAKEMSIKSNMDDSSSGDKEKYHLKCQLPSLTSFLDK